jgi:hypothetical protein
MRVIKLTIGIATLALAVASAASTYNITISTPVSVGDKQLKPGDYKVEMEGEKAVFKSGKTVVAELPATAEQGDKKYANTSLDITDSHLKEIRVGGTTTKIVIKSGPNESAKN